MARTWSPHLVPLSLLLLLFGGFWGPPWLPIASWVKTRPTSAVPFALTARRRSIPTQAAPLGNVPPPPSPTDGPHHQFNTSPGSWRSSAVASAAGLLLAAAAAVVCRMRRAAPRPSMHTPLLATLPQRWAMAPTFAEVSDFVPGLAGQVIPREEAFRLAEEGDRLITAMSANGEVRVRAVGLTHLMGDAQQMHKMSALATVALGQTVASALLLAAGRTDELETFQLRINGDGPLNGVIAVADGTGRVRGYCGDPQLVGVDMATAIGQGTIEVIRSHPNPDFPGRYNGITPIEAGNVPQDVTLYLDRSEQVRSALAAGVSLPKPEAVGVEGRLFTAGYLVQLLPGASERTIQILELNIVKLLVEKDAQGAGELLRKGVSPAQMAEQLLLDLEPINWTASTPRWWCKDCSTESVYTILNILPPADLKEILDSPEALNARCEWCSRDMGLERARVEGILERKTAPKPPG